MPQIVPEQARKDDKQAGQMAGDYSMPITPTALPLQTYYQRLELQAVEFDLTAMANAGPVRLTWIQSPRGKPDSQAVVYQHFIWLARGLANR